METSDPNSLRINQVRLEDHLLSLFREKQGFKILNPERVFPHNGGRSGNYFTTKVALQESLWPISTLFGKALKVILNFPCSTLNHPQWEVEQQHLDNYFMEN